MAVRIQQYVVLLAWMLSAAAIHAAPSDTLAELEARQDTDPMAWRALAIEAREAGEPELAADAIERAAELGLAPLRADFERARQHVAADRPGEAIALLEKLVAGGFTAIQAISGDPVLGTLAGNERFDALLADMEAKAFPCAHQERFREFDFWVGEWDVHVEDGTFAGTNRITAEEKGCVLVEHWTSASGATGQSINYLDAATGEWVQVWNSESGGQISIRGGMTPEGMRLEGQIHYIGNGTTAPFRGLWTPLPDGRVRQFFEQSNDGGETWTPWFEGFYTRREPTN
ncbi:MAG: hypothetical protein U5K76_03705 [Woeseiaceae bacterium]|nr:hypothetical protein [Woeseiaceae bacterium]